MKYSLTALALALTIPGVAFAVEQGTLGQTSTGSFVITLEVTDPANQIEITGLDDIVFDYTIGDALPTALIEEFCVYATQANLYDLDIAATVLTNGSENINYKILYTDLSTGGQSSEWTVADVDLAGQTLTDLVTSDTEDCPTTNAASLAVTLLESPGTAENTSAAITMTVSPS